LLLTSLEPYYAEIEHHFADQRRALFTGVMGWYLGLIHKLRNFVAGGSWRSKIPWAPSLPAMPGQVPRTVDFNLSSFLIRCSQEASDRHLASRHRAFTNRLLLDAEARGFTMRLLNEQIEKVARNEWNARNAQAMLEALTAVERTWAEPPGPRKWIQWLLVTLGNTLPSLALLGMTVLLLWQYLYEHRSFDRGDVILPLAVVFFTMVILHILIAILIPMRWPQLRSQFHSKLESRMETELTSAYSAIPLAVASDILADRERTLQYLGEVKDVATWLKGREQAVGVEQLFGEK
jgi:hypothetical protein